jgi:nitrate/nitrite transporter NarK
VSAVASRLVSGLGAGGAALVAAVQPDLLVPVVLAIAVLGGLPLLLIATLALVAVYSPDPARRTAAAKILDRLLSALRPREPSTPTPRRKRTTGPGGLP